MPPKSKNTRSGKSAAKESPEKSGSKAGGRSGAKAQEKDSLMPPVKLEAHSTEKKQNQKKFFTVGEDSTILAVYKKHRSKKDFSADKLEKTAEEIQAKLSDWSVEAISRRILKYFTSMNKTDEDKISKAATVNYPYFRNKVASTQSTRKQERATKSIGLSKSSPLLLLRQVRIL